MNDQKRTWDLSQLSPYERQAWQGIQDWQDNPARHRLVSEKSRQRARRIGQSAANTWKEIPGSAQLDEVVEHVLAGGNEAITDAVTASLRRDRILQAARDSGASVEELSDLRDLDLEVLDKICPS